MVDSLRTEGYAEGVHGGYTDLKFGGVRGGLTEGVLRGYAEGVRLRRAYHVEGLRG